MSIFYIFNRFLIGDKLFTKKAKQFGQHVRVKCIVKSIHWMDFIVNPGKIIFKKGKELTNMYTKEKLWEEATEEAAELMANRKDCEGYCLIIIILMMMVAVKERIMAIL